MKDVFKAREGLTEEEREEWLDRIFETEYKIKLSDLMKISPEIRRIVYEEPAPARLAELVIEGRAERAAEMEERRLARERARRAPNVASMLVTQYDIDEADRGMTRVVRATP